MSEPERASVKDLGFREGAWDSGVPHAGAADVQSLACVMRRHGVARVVLPSGLTVEMGPEPASPLPPAPPTVPESPEARRKREERLLFAASEGYPDDDDAEAGT